jgi:hypothetical protein
MPLFSCFTPFGAGFAFSGAPSHGETIFRSMISSLGAQTESLSTEEGTRMRAFCYATAMHLARVRYTLEHAGYQLDPLKVCEMLPKREGEYGIVPGAYDSIDERRATLAARLLAPKGAAFNTVATALAILLGEDLRGYLPTPYADAVVAPAGIGDQPMNMVSTNILPKLFSLAQSITTGLGSPQWVRYELVELPSIPDQNSPTLPPRNLLVGETVVLDVGNNVRHERCTIFGLRELTPGVLEMWLIPTLAHDDGVPCTNWQYPYWLSTKRYNLIALAAAAAADPETRRKVNELMAKMQRAVSTWSIVQEDPLNPGHTGVFLADTSGADTQTCEDVVLPLLPFAP